MKDSKFFCVFAAVVVILVGVFIAWDAAAPQLINGGRIVGGCRCYDPPGHKKCASTVGKTCTIKIPWCDMDSNGNLTCTPVPSSSGSNPCLLPAACVDEKAKVCG